jgi:paraquat-inducible protein A
LTTTNALTACRECDALQREVELPDRAAAECVRCGAELYRNRPGTLDLSVAVLIGAATLFFVANVYPLVSLDAQGFHTTTTLFGTAHALYETGEPSLAALVFMTTILFPAAEIVAMLYLTASLRLGRVPPSMPVLVRTIDAVRPWGMISVFMLGALVSMVRLTQIATVIPGVALYALGGMILLFAASEATYDARALWERAGELRR